jgi:hypothetical protein
MALAARRRLPLVVLLLPPESAAADQCLKDLRIRELGVIAVFHQLTAGTAEATNFLSAAGSRAPQAPPSCHVFAPAARGLPPMQLGGEQLTGATLRAAVLRAAALTGTEANAIADSIPATQAALQTAIREMQVTQQPAKPVAAPVKPTPTAPETTIQTSKPADATTTSSPPARTSIEVRVLGVETTTVHIAGARDSTSLVLLRRQIAKELGHGNFSFQSATGSSVASTQEERYVAGDVRPSGGAVTVHVTAAQQTIDAARLQAAATAESAAVRHDSSTEKTGEPASQRGPRPEELPSVTVHVADKAPFVLRAAGSDAVSKHWETLATHVGCPAAELVLTFMNADSDTHRTLDNDSAAECNIAELRTARRVEASRKDTSRGASAPASPTAAAGGDAAASPTGASATAGDTVKVRLMLPTAGAQPTLTCSPSDTLSVVFDRAAQEVDTRDIWLVQAYPPRRFTEAELTETLASLRLSGSVAIRVVRQAPAAAAQPPAANEGEAPQTRSNLGQIAGALGGVLSGSARLVGGLFGRNQGAAVAAGEQDQRDGPGDAAQAPRRPPQTAHSLGELRRREAEEEDRKKQAGDGKNTYFGGDSTEYQGK